MVGEMGRELRPAEECVHVLDWDKYQYGADWHSFFSAPARAFEDGVSVLENWSCMELIASAKGHTAQIPGTGLRLTCKYQPVSIPMPCIIGCVEDMPDRLCHSIKVSSTGKPYCATLPWPPFNGTAAICETDIQMLTLRGVREFVDIKNFDGDNRRTTMDKWLKTSVYYSKVGCATLASCRKYVADRCAFNVRASRVLDASRLAIKRQVKADVGAPGGKGTFNLPATPTA